MSTIYQLPTDSLNRFWEQLNTAATDAKAKEPHRAQKKSYASSGYKCALQQYYARTGVQPTNRVYNPDYEVSAELGNSLHTIVQKRLIQADMCLYIPRFAKDGLAVLYERTARNEGIPGEGEIVLGAMQPVIEAPLNETTLTETASARVNDYGISCRIDSGIKASGDKVYLEIKTKSVKDFLPQNKRWFDEFLANTEMQIQYALELWDSPTVGRFDYALVLVISRDVNPDTKQYIKQLWLVEPNQDVAIQELDRLAHLNKLVEIKRSGVEVNEPEPEPTRGSCRIGRDVGCPYYDLCPASEAEKTGRSN